MSRLKICMQTCIKYIFSDGNYLKLFSQNHPKSLSGMPASSHLRRSKLSYEHHDRQITLLVSCDWKYPFIFKIDTVEVSFLIYVEVILFVNGIIRMYSGSGNKLYCKNSWDTDSLYGKCVFVSPFWTLWVKQYWLYWFFRIILFIFGTFCGQQIMFVVLSIDSISYS